MTKTDILIKAFNTLRYNGVVHTQKDLANLLGVDAGQLSRALKGGQVSDNLIAKIEAFMNDGVSAVPAEAVAMFPALDSTSAPDRTELLPVIPTEAMAGTLGEFASQVASYDCEKMVSPIKGADYAMKVCGESMSPEFPNGSTILIKKINENAFIPWGNVLVLDTCNGAIIKQVRKTDKENVVECISLNPTFQPFTIDTSFINGWYRILMVLSLK